MHKYLHLIIVFNVSLFFLFMSSQTFLVPLYSYLSHGNTASQDDSKDEYGHLQDRREYSKVAVLKGQELRKSDL